MGIDDLVFHVKEVEKTVGRFEQSEALGLMWWAIICTQSDGKERFWSSPYSRADFDLFETEEGAQGAMERIDQPDKLKPYIVPILAFPISRDPQGSE